jgi:hypothetical protein
MLFLSLLCFPFCPGKYILLLVAFGSLSRDSNLSATTSQLGDLGKVALPPEPEFLMSQVLLAGLL